MKNLILSFLITVISVSANTQNNVQIDASFALNKNIVYFIRGNNVVKYDFDNDKVLETKLLSNNAFSGVNFSKIDAALNLNGNKIYFFSDQFYTRFDLASFSADEGYPKNINLWGFGYTQIDAAISWTEKAYFFAGNQYSRYSKSEDKIDEGYPKQINNNTWPGLSYSNIDAALTMPNGKTYFFYGDKYTRYDQKTDKADEGYPKSLSAWKGLTEALTNNATNNNNSNNNIIKNDKAKGFIAEKHTVNLDVPISDPSSILCTSYIRRAYDDGFYLAYPNKSVVYVQKFDANIQKVGYPLVLEDYWMSDFLPMKDGSIIFLLGRSVKNTYLGEYPNTLYFVKMNKDGNLESPKLIFGENKHTAGESWFDGRSKGLINYNGQEFGIYFEVQKNWAKEGEKDDIHNGDMFVATDLDGNLKEGREHFWTASHSSTINLSSIPNGNFYTLTIGDAYPYGLQLYNRNDNFNKVVWPPEEDYVSYENVNSTNAAGILDYMDISEGNIIAVLGTLEHPNIGYKSKVDPFFLKFDTKGNIITKKWLAQTPARDEVNISICKNKNDEYIIAWSAGNEYDNNYKPDYLTISVVNNNGEFIIAPQSVDYPFGTYSEIIRLNNGRIVWANTSRSPSSNIDIYVGEFRN